LGGGGEGIKNLNDLILFNLNLYTWSQASLLHGSIQKFVVGGGGV
jgi:hypothetical protein